MKIVFFGSDQFVLPILEAIHAQYMIPLVLTTEKLSSDPISSFAQKNKLELLQVTSFTPEVITAIKKTETDIAVLAYFGLILPQEVLTLFPKGIINIHPSLLPKYRGPTPVQTAMIAGEHKTGVSIIRLDTQVDHGPLLAQKEEPILATDTDESLHKRLFTKGADLLLQSLPAYLAGTLQPLPQDDTKATFTKKLSRDAGFFDSNTPPPAQILHRMINAYYPWPGVWTTIDIHGQQKRVKLLPGNKIHVQDKKPMSYKDFLNGYPEMKDWVAKISY